MRVVQEDVLGRLRLVTLFAGTSAYYRQFRSGVPESVAVVLDEAAPQRRPRRLLDLGTGTGFVIRALLNRFDDIVGVDTDPDLLAVAEGDLAPAIPSEARLSFVLSRAEEFQPPAGWTADLVTICRTFHWLDRPSVLASLDSVVADGGVVAIFGDRSIWAAGSAWKQEAKTTVTEFLGDRRRAGTGTYREPERTQLEYLADSAFSDVEQLQVPVRRERTLDSIIGYLHSTSFAAPHLFGDRLQAFDDTLRERLPVHSTDGIFVDDNQFDILLARRASHH
jgi:ubiquinone/menaquinone biosynthesis C-methylase UbiE